MLELVSWVRGGYFEEFFDVGHVESEGLLSLCAVELDLA